MTPLVLAPLALGLVAVAVQLLRRPPAAPALEAPVGTPNARLLAAALSSLPSASAVLKPPDTLWDQILGGRLAPFLDGLTWGYFSTWLGTKPDGEKKRGGTTCGIVAAYWAARAGWPVAWINRRKDDAAAPGGGFTPGAHITKLHEGARKAGWLITFDASPASSSSTRPATSISGVPVELRPGDLYGTEKPEGLVFDGQKVDSTHVGVVKSVGTPDAKGNREVVTLDGGQTCTGEGGRPMQCAHWNTRRLTPAGLLVMLVKDNNGQFREGPAARVSWVIRAPERRAA